MSEAASQQRLLELSRRVAAQQASAVERAELDRLLGEQPARQADVEWDATFAAQLQAKVDEMPQLPGWERTQRLLLAEADQPARASVTHRSARSARQVLDRCSDWLASLLGFPVNAQAIAVCVIAAQVGIIGLLATQPAEPQYSEVRSGAGAAAPSGPLLRVSFRADLREADLRRALIAIGGEIVAGPGQLGIYLVRVREGDLQAAATRLRESGAVELVELAAPGP